MRPRASLAMLTGVLLGVWAALGHRTLPVDDAAWSERFDGYFRHTAKHYFGPGFDWRWLKAQAIAESSLRPEAVSVAGARGLMQILPSTYEDIRRGHPYFDAIDDPRWNVAAGGFWLRRQYDKWAGRVATEHRLRFSLASYNAGFRRILDARRGARAQGGDPRDWSHVARHAPAETRVYVARIRRLMGERR